MTNAEPVALAVFAHPDDETLLAGALISKLIDDGWRFHLLCVAPGDDDDLSNRMQLAAADLGIESVRSLRYSAKSALPSVESAGGSPQLISAPESVVAEQISGQLLDLRPQMVLTHSAKGDYGHPDHAFCHRATTAAARQALSAAAVYALEWPGLAASIARRLNRSGSAQPESQPSISSVTAELAAQVWKTETHNVYRYLGLRKRAARHYRSEMASGPIHLRLMEAAPTWLQRMIIGKSSIRRVQ